MSLQLITGSANSGKTGVAYRLLRDAVARREQAVLVLPSAPDVARARSELAVAAPLGLKITTFDGYLTDLWSQWGDGRALVTAGLRQIAVAGIAAETTGSVELSRLAQRCIVELARGTGEHWRSQRGPCEGSGVALGKIIERYGAELVAQELVEPAEAAHCPRELRHSAPRAGRLPPIHRSDPRPARADSRSRCGQSGLGHRNHPRGTRSHFNGRLVSG